MIKILKIHVSIILILCACTTTPRNTDIWTAEKSFPDGQDWAIGNTFKYLTYVQVLSKFEEGKGYIIYDIKDAAVGLYYIDFIHYNRIFMNDEARLQLIGLIDKYLDWEEVAKKNSETLEKDIGNIETYCYWNIKNGETYLSHERKMNVSFFSQNKKRHQLVFTFPTYSAFGNQYITHKPETIYLDKDYVINLRNLLSNKTTKEEISKIRKDQENKKDKYK